MGESENNLSEEEKKKLEKLQKIRVKFLRLVHRLGLSPEESMAAQVLYRFTLLAGSQNGQIFSVDAAKRMVVELEAEGKEYSNFNGNILVLGKSGVGKSATVNSIFGEEKAPIDAFETGTTSVKEISGFVDGVKVLVSAVLHLHASAPPCFCTSNNGRHTQAHRFNSCNCFPRQQCHLKSTRRKKKSGLRIGTILGIVIGDVAGIGIGIGIVALIFMDVYHLKKRKALKGENGWRSEGGDRLWRENGGRELGCVMLGEIKLVFWTNLYFFKS